MTDAHKKTQIAKEVVKGDRALKAAEALLKLALYEDAVSRFYYAAFHFASAVLLSVDVAAKSHRALMTLFSEHFVQTGVFTPRQLRELRELQGLRESSDYDRSFTFDDEGANEKAAVARALIDDFREYLQSAKWI